MKKFLSIACALLLIGATAAPAAYADHRGRGWSRGYDHHRHYDRRHHRDNDNDAVVAGVLGLAIGAIIGSAASRPRYAEPPRYQAPRGCGYEPCGGPPPQPYYEQSYQGGGGYYGPQSYDDGYEERLCVVREQQWDPYVGRTLTIERQVPC